MDPGLTAIVSMTQREWGLIQEMSMDDRENTSICGLRLIPTLKEILNHHNMFFN